MSEREHILYQNDVDDCKDRHLQHNNKAHDTYQGREASITTQSTTLTTNDNQTTSGKKSQQTTQTNSSNNNQTAA